MHCLPCGHDALVDQIFSAPQAQATPRESILTYHEATSRWGTNGTDMSVAVLELFVFDEHIGALENALAQASVRTVERLLPLVWHLRQRDATRMQLLAKEVESLLPTSTLTETEQARTRARLQLTRAETYALSAEFEQAEELTALAVSAFKHIDDETGIGDGYWLLASIWTDRGNEARAVQCLELALEHYRNCGDQQRVDAGEARTLANNAFSDTARAAADLQKAFSDPESHHGPDSMWIAVARANVAGLTDDPLTSIKYDLQAHQIGMASGQIRTALACAVNAAESFATLGEISAALDWSERALQKARAMSWPASIGICLMQVGDVMRLLGRPDEARTYLQEALAVMVAVSRSRNHEQVLGNLGQLALDVGNNAEALEWFSKFEQQLGATGEADLMMRLRRGQATALSRLGHPEQAQIHIHEALLLARATGNADEQIRVLRTCAELHRDHTLPAPELMTAATAELHFLDEATRIVGTISGYTAPVGLLNQLARAYASNHDYARAYEFALAANAAAAKGRRGEAQNRALAMKVRQEIDRAQAEGQHLRKLATTLQETNATLETLGIIGRDITASLDVSEVCKALYRHVNDLLDATSFWIFLLDDNGTTLTSSFGAESHQQVTTSHSIPLDHPVSLTARCARERGEIVLNELPHALKVNTFPGTLPSQSLLFAPLEVGKRFLGVITIQSLKANAYGERERSIFRTLSAYGAIALDNAATYAKVEVARATAALQEQELRIAAAAFESLEGLLITDADRIILRVNLAFTKVTGYEADEIIGQRPVMFRSPRMNPEDYDRMNEQVRTTGGWQGEIFAQRKDGSSFPLWISISSVRNNAGEITNLVYAIVDITERKLAEDEIRSLAFYDALTDLPNRRLLLDRLRQAMATSTRSEQYGALLFIDLDNFKKLNDTRGHDIGDLLLQQVAQRLGDCLREGDTAARLGGDEFVILLCELSTEILEAAEKTELVAEKILSTLNQPYFLGAQQHHSTPSIGVCLYHGQTETIDDLLKQADLAMYQSKAAGRNAIRFFDSAMQIAVSTHAALEADMRRALESKQFVLDYQAQVDTKNRVVGAEALVSWQHPVRGKVSPGEFIPLAEETGLILPLGEWVLETACRQLHAWAENPATAHLTLAVNISARQFHTANFVDQVTAVLRRTEANPAKLKLELTESLLLKDVEIVIIKMKALISLGVRFSLDDFGTGYSSLSYLKRLPFEQLKIDQSFVRDIFVDANDLAIVRAIVTLGRTLGLAVIAEGVETEEQRKFLESTGCDAYQGYLFGRPVSAENILNSR